MAKSVRESNQKTDGGMKCYLLLDTSLNSSDSVRGLFADLDDAFSWALHYIIGMNAGMTPESIQWTYDITKQVYKTETSSFIVMTVWLGRTT